MSEKKVEKKPCAFSGRAVYNEDAIKAFCKVQYAAFKKKNQITFILCGIAFVVFAVCGVISGTLSIVVGAIGCWILTLPGVVSKSDADKIIAAMDGKFSTSKYSFDDKGFDIVAGSETNRLGYDNMIRLIEDDDYFFFFAAPQLAYIVEKKTLNPHDTEKFKAYTSSRVGLEWTRSRPWYSVNVKGLINDRKNTRKIPSIDKDTHA